MAQIFGRKATPLGRIVLIGGILMIVAGFYIFDVLFKSPYATGVGRAQPQPVPFSHAHHARDLGIDCRYCHTTVENGAFAGIPPVHTCMTCHSQIWAGAPMLETVRESFRTGKALEWTRVNRLPDYVYFNHSIHIQKGVACVTCHGSVGDMALTAKGQSLQMKWCLECHRHPERYIGPKEAVFRPTLEPQYPQDQKLEDYVKKYHVQSMTSCYTCHR